MVCGNVVVLFTLPGHSPPTARFTMMNIGPWSKGQAPPKLLVLKVA